MPAPDDPEPKPRAEKGPFLAAVADTGPMIEELQAERDALNKQRGDLETRANDLTVKIDALNGLRQAHGLPGL